MAKNLIIVESPAKARTISKFLSKDYTILPCMGHVRDLPAKTLGVDPEKDFAPRYVVSRDKNPTIKKLKEAAGKASTVFLASDHDREGEAIAWHLSQVLKKEIAKKELHRITFNEITKPAINDALSHPGVIDDKLVDAQQARRILDRIVGYMVSPMLWKVISKNLSAGRVQSVALRLICERQQEIDEFEPKEYWNIDAVLSKGQLTPFSAQLAKWNDKKAEIKDKKAADEVLATLANQKFTLSLLERKQKKVQPLPPYITSTLQQDASRLLNFSGKKTMMIAQQLYEGVDVGEQSAGLITYMRTDSLRVSEVALEDVRKMIEGTFGKEMLSNKARRFKVKKDAQDAHEAIRPTNPALSPDSIASSLNRDQLRLYRLIWSRFVATQMAAADTEQLNVEITAGPGLFKTSGTSIINQGFLQIYPHVSVASGTLIDAGYALHNVLDAHPVTGTQKFTKPPASYSEASLIKELEARRIGRPSTYAAITNTILERKYVQIKDKKFSPTELGKLVNQFLTGHFDKLFNVEFTANMEELLDHVEQGDIRWQSILHTHYDLIQELSQGIDFKTIRSQLTQTTDIKCDKCGSPMLVKLSTKGRFLACSNYPTCSNIKNFTTDDDGNIKVEEPKTLNENCPDCGSPLIERKGRFGAFIACSNYPKCKFTKTIGTGVKCPECKEGEIVPKRSKKGRTFYGCSNYPKCNYMSYYKPKAVACPACGHYYMEEHRKEGKTVLKCPSCGEEAI